jgi:predicted DCC family thiol-disulfide oxidoreductase YuxK
MRAPQPILLVYDKQCPACDLYCSVVRIRADVGELELVDARAGGPIMDEITAANLDIDKGMVLEVGGRLYYGSDAIHVLSLMSTRAGFFNRLSYWSFRSKTVSGVLYPVLRGETAARPARATRAGAPLPLAASSAAGCSSA